MAQSGDVLDDELGKGNRGVMRPERVKLGAGKQDNKKDQKKPSIKFSDPVSANKSTTKKQKPISWLKMAQPKTL